MFAADGTMLHCPAKSALMHILEKLPSSTSECRIVGQEEECPELRMRVSIIDAMAEVQSLDKPEQIYATARTLLITSFVASLKRMETVMRSD